MFPNRHEVFGVPGLETEGKGYACSLGHGTGRTRRCASGDGALVISRGSCANMAFAGDFTPTSAKHSKAFSLICLWVGVDRMRRIFAPIRKRFEA